jgi:hypothetical protein
MRDGKEEKQKAGRTALTWGGWAVKVLSRTKAREGGGDVTNLEYLRAVVNGGATENQPFSRQHHASEVTCVSVCSGTPRRVLRETFRKGARFGLRLTVPTDTTLVGLTVSGTRESATNTRDQLGIRMGIPTGLLEQTFQYTTTHTHLYTTPRRTGYIRTLIQHHVFSSSRSILTLLLGYYLWYFTLHSSTSKTNPTYK